MKRFIFCSKKGSTFSPMGGEVNNDQYLGEAYGHTAQDAFKELVKQHPDIAKEGYDFSNCWSARLVDNPEQQYLTELLMRGLAAAQVHDFEAAISVLGDLDRLRQRWTGHFTVTSVTRDDLKCRGYNPDVDDETMFSIAAGIQDTIVEPAFWDSLDAACDEHEIMNPVGLVQDMYRNYKTRTGNEPLLARIDVKDVEGNIERVLVALQGERFDDDSRDEQVYYYFEGIDELTEHLFEPFASMVTIVNPENVEFDNWAN